MKKNAREDPPAEESSLKSLRWLTPIGATSLPSPVALDSPQRPHQQKIGKVLRRPREHFPLETDRPNDRAAPSKSPPPASPGNASTATAALTRLSRHRKTYDFHAFYKEKEKAKIATALVEPQTYEEAITGPNSRAWKPTTVKELDALIKRGTWKLASQPLDRLPITCKQDLLPEDSANPHRFS